MSTGEQLKEAQAINKSLSALGDVISALAQEQAHIPYRNHKLTMLMSDSIGGTAKTLMFVNVSPTDNNLDESQVGRPASRSPQDRQCQARLVGMCLARSRTMKIRFRRGLKSSSLGHIGLRSCYCEGLAGRAPGGWAMKAACQVGLMNMSDHGQQASLVGHDMVEVASSEGGSRQLAVLMPRTPGVMIEPHHCSASVMLAKQDMHIGAQSS